MIRLISLYDFFYLHVYRHLLAHSNFMPMIPALLGPYYFLVNLILKSILLVSSMFGMKELLRVHVGPPLCIALISN